MIIIHYNEETFKSYAEINGKRYEVKVWGEDDDGRQWMTIILDTDDLYLVRESYD